MDAAVADNFVCIQMCPKMNMKMVLFITMMMTRRRRRRRRRGRRRRAHHRDGWPGKKTLLRHTSLTRTLLSAAESLNQFALGRGVLIQRAQF